MLLLPSRADKGKRGLLNPSPETPKASTPTGLNAKLLNSSSRRFEARSLTVIFLAWGLRLSTVSPDCQQHHLKLRSSYPNMGEALHVRALVDLDYLEVHG